MVSSSIRLTAWLQNSSGRNDWRDWYEQSHPRLSPLWLSASSSACHGLLIITVITPLPPASPARQKCQRTEAGERGNCWHAQMRQRDVAALILQNTKELKTMLKLKMMLCVMMLPLVVVGCTSKQSVSQYVRLYASGVDNAASPDWRAPLNRIISPSERLITMQVAGRNPEVYSAGQFR